jgi:hypothetical protein
VIDFYHTCSNNVTLSSIRWEELWSGAPECLIDSLGLPEALLVTDVNPSGVGTGGPHSVAAQNKSTSGKLSC